DAAADLLERPRQRRRDREDRDRAEPAARRGAGQELERDGGEGGHERERAHRPERDARAGAREPEQDAQPDRDERDGDGEEQGRRRSGLPYHGPRRAPRARSTAIHNALARPRRRPWLPLAFTIGGW